MECTVVRKGNVKQMLAGEASPKLLAASFQKFAVYRLR